MFSRLRTLEQPGQIIVVEALRNPSLASLLSLLLAISRIPQKFFDSPARVFALAKVLSHDQTRTMALRPYRVLKLTAIELNLLLKAEYFCLKLAVCFNSRS